jgi:adenylate cyclase
VLVEEQRKLIRPILGKHNGREVKTMGDAFLIEFSSALDAVRCAYDIQRATHESNISSSEEKRIHLRVGVHLGDVVESQGDIFGDAVNIASRIVPLAEDGGVCLTRQVYDQVQNKLELQMTSLGSKTLKNVAGPLEVYQMVMPWEVEKPANSAQLNKKRIVVLPFVNMSPDPNDEYFADGMTEELITSLSRVRGLTAIARASVIRYKASQKGVSEIGRELGAGTLIGGSVRKAGSRVRITVQMVDTQTEGQVWAENYDRQLDDIFEIQGEVAQKVAKELEVQLLESEKRKLESKPTEDTEAYTLYLRARYQWNSRSEEGVKSAISHFEGAIHRDPEYALALVGLADCYDVSALFGYLRPKTVFPRAKELALRALTARGDLAEAHASRGEILMHFSYDWGTAARELERALQINPNYAMAHVWRSSCYAILGQFGEAIAEANRAVDLDPFSVVVMNELAKNLYYARRYDDAIERFTHALRIEPGSGYLHKGLAETYVQRYMSKEAVSEIDKAIELSKNGVLILDSAACVYALAGEERKSRAMLAKLAKLSADRFVPSYGRAGACAALGDKEKALELLEVARKEHGWLSWVKVDPIFDSLRQEKKFHSLLRKMNFKS